MRFLRALGISVCSTVLVGVGLVAPVAAQDLSTSVFPASQDAYVNAASPGTNYNSQLQLVVAGSPDRLSYLTFAVTGLTKPVTHARLRMETRTVDYAGSPQGGHVFRVASTWSESTVTYATRPTLLDNAEVTHFGAVAAGRVYEADVTVAVTGNGVISFGIVSTNPNGAYYTSRESGIVGPRLIVYSGTPGTAETTLLAAGDIADCRTPWDEATAGILDVEPGTVAALGDLAYERGTSEEFAACYTPSWGRHRARTRPAVGNHEYLTPGATPYWNYFGAAAGPVGKGWYSYTVDTWHVVVLNSNCSEVGGCGVGSEQERWLRADLAAHSARCTLAYWHHPLFASGNRTYPQLRPLYQALYDAGAEVVLNAHNHQYERFAPQDPTGAADPVRGIRQFIVGTGGRVLTPDFGTVAPNSEVRNGAVYGVLRLTLLPTEYRWRFLAPTGHSFSEAGTSTCH
ncbi:DUF7594 domain-containing protein [Micromonospora cathayae]|uniref:DNRLRE domain-containing protein n=1 Tax=Micromonospora cathayae TaxID=3028804 RepID=A0ABY7ZRK3_9ACTN|nr:DNRLRE domain-containing protein [Micromonospora sp. HUAS 3]WDZ85607.1 DNRLRE domain-containing protein [Micromonospora sp. HUAS 3]